MFITALFIIARTWRQPRYPLTDQCIKELWYICMWYIYTIWYILPGHEKGHIWFSSNKIVEPNDYYTERSRSERQKNKYCILIHIYMGSRKMVLINLLQGSKGDPDREQICGHSRGRRGWDGLREQRWNIHITICKIRLPVEICCTMQGAQSQCSVITQRGGVGWKVGERFMREGHMYA